jgi:hypothetical protein
MDKNIYILLSRTPTKFGGLIRKIAKQRYNHASIVLDDDFKHIYAFARKKHNAPLLGGLVRESLDRFTLRRDSSVPVMVFKIPVTKEQYETIKSIINEMLDNKKYVYNLFSVFLYPIFKGFTVKNAFSCIEFVSYILQYLGLLTDKAACKYRPDDLITELSEYIYKEDDIRECITYNPIHNTYFDKWQFRIIPKSCAAICRILKHGFCLTPMLHNNSTFHIDK